MSNILRIMPGKYVSIICISYLTYAIILFMLDDDEKRDDITSLETHSQKSLFCRTIPEFIKAYMILIEGTEEKGRFDIAESPVFIGRDKGMDIHLDDSSVSREHAVLFFYDNRFYIRDLKSTNGTLVNGRRIEQIALNYKDLIQLGKCSLRFFVEHAGISESIKQTGEEEDS